MSASLPGQLRWQRCRAQPELAPENRRILPRNRGDALCPRSSMIAPPAKTADLSVISHHRCWTRILFASRAALDKLGLVCDSVAPHRPPSKCWNELSSRAERSRQFPLLPSALRRSDACRLIRGAAGLRLGPVDQSQQSRYGGRQPTMERPWPKRPHVRLRRILAICSGGTIEPRSALGFGTTATGKQSHRVAAGALHPPTHQPSARIGLRIHRLRPPRAARCGSAPAATGTRWHRHCGGDNRNHRHRFCGSIACAP